MNFWCGLCCLLVVPVVGADELARFMPSQKLGGGERGECSISVRVIDAFARLRDGADGLPQSSEALRDIADQLDSLPFTRYRLLNTVEEVTPILEEVRFRLRGVGNEPHLLVVSPHSVTEQDRVHFTVHWRGSGDELLLSSQMSLANRGSVVLVAEGAEKEVLPESTILAIRISCA